MLSHNVYKVFGKINYTLTFLTKSPESGIASKKPQIFMPMCYSLFGDILPRKEEHRTDLDDYFNHLQHMHHGLLFWELTTSKNRRWGWSQVKVIFSLVLTLGCQKAFRGKAMCNVDTWSKTKGPYEYSFSSFPTTWVTLHVGFFFQGKKEKKRKEL